MRKIFILTCLVLTSFISASALAQSKAMRAFNSAQVEHYVGNNNNTLVNLTITPGYFGVYVTNVSIAQNGHHYYADPDAKLTDVSVNWAEFAWNTSWFGDGHVKGLISAPNSYAPSNISWQNLTVNGYTFQPEDILLHPAAG